MVSKKNLVSILFGLIILLSIGFLIAYSDLYGGYRDEVSRADVATLKLNFNITEDEVFNFTIVVNNTRAGLEHNITEVNVTLPSYCTLSLGVDGKGNNWTNANGSLALNNYGSQTLFSNFSTTRWGTTAPELRWRNASSVTNTYGFLVNQSNQTKIFAFNATCDTPGRYDGANNITVAILNATGSILFYSFNMTVNDTTSPEFSSSSSPTKSNYNYSGPFEFNISISDNWLNNNWKSAGANKVVGTAVGRAGVNITMWNSTGQLGCAGDLGCGTNDTVDLFVALNRTRNYWNVTMNVSQFADGVYNFTIYFNDTSGNINSTNITNIRFDQTAPSEVNITNSSGSTFDVLKGVKGNFSNTIILNFSAVENITSTADMWVNISTANATRKQVLYTRASSPKTVGSITYWNISVDTTLIADGLYNITIYANNSALDNTGVALMNTTYIEQAMRIDNTHPTGSVSCSPATVTSGETVTCSCTPGDGTGSSGINSSATSTTANPSTSNTGTFSVGCSFADLAGNGGTTSTTYTVEQNPGSSPSSGGGGGSSSASFYTTTIPTGQELSEVQTVEKQVSVKSRVSIKINKEAHYIGVRSLTVTSAVVEIMSDPIQVTLDVGKDTKADVNDDGYYDVYVKLNSITGGKADLIIKYLNEEVPKETPEVAPVEEDKSIADTIKEEIPIITEKVSSNKGLWIGIGIVIVLVLVGIGYRMKKKKY